MFACLLFLLTLSDHASARKVEGYDKGNIKFSDEARAGKHEVKVGIRKAVDPSEVETLMYLYMSRTCGEEYFYLDMFSKNPESGMIQNADFDFHCTKQPDFAHGDATMQKRDLDTHCATAKPAYLKRACATRSQ